MGHNFKWDMQTTQLLTTPAHLSLAPETFLCTCYFSPLMNILCRHLYLWMSKSLDNDSAFDVFFATSRLCCYMTNVTDPNWSREAFIVESVCRWEIFVYLPMKCRPLINHFHWRLPKVLGVKIYWDRYLVPTWLFGCAFSCAGDSSSFSAAVSVFQSQVILRCGTRWILCSFGLKPAPAKSITHFYGKE